MKARWRKCERCGQEFYDLYGKWTLCHDCQRLSPGEIIVAVIVGIMVVGLVVFLMGGQQ